MRGRDSATRLMWMAKPGRRLPPVRRRVQATEEARSYGRRASLLSIGVGITGLITYLYFAIASHELSKEQYGQVAVLWSAVFIVVSVLQRPVEQLLSRTVSENLANRSPDRPHRPGRGDDPARGRRRFDVSRSRCADRSRTTSCDGNSTLYWIGVAAVTAYGASYFARGFLAGSHRLTVYALLIISESVARTAFPLAVALGDRLRPDGGRARHRRRPDALPDRRSVRLPPPFWRRAAPVPSPPPSPRRRPIPRSSPWPEEAGFAAGVFLIMLCEQTFLNAGPLLVNATAGAAAAGYIFNVLMIARAPLQLFQAVSTSLLPHLTRLGSQGNEEDFRASVRVTILAIAGFAGLVALAMLIAGPQLMQIAFGKNHAYRAGGPGDRQRRHGPVPIGRDAQPGGAREGAAPPRLVLLDRLCGRLRDLDAGPAHQTTTSTGSRSATWGRPPCSAGCSTGSTGSRSCDARGGSSRARRRRWSSSSPRPTRPASDHQAVMRGRASARPVGLSVGRPPLIAI